MGELILRQEDIHALLESASGDAVKLYLFLRSGYPPHTAGGVLRLSASRLDSAVLELRRLCLLPSGYTIAASGGPVEYHPENAPIYSDAELTERLAEPDGGFSRLRKLCALQSGKQVGRNVALDKKAV